MHYYEHIETSVTQIQPIVINYEDIGTKYTYSDILPKLYDGKKAIKDKWTKMSTIETDDGIKEITYIANVNCAFDTETTTVHGEMNKRSFHHGYVYEWTFGIGVFVIIGRKLSDFYELIDNVTSLLKLGENSVSVSRKTNMKTITMRYLRVWVANLGYDFQFIRKHLGELTVFAKSEHSILTAKTNSGLIFQDALSITNSNLASIPSLYNLPTRKAVGDLDYKLVRNTLTPLDSNELRYCINDVVVLLEFSEWIYLNYTSQGLKVPLTQTGMLRDSVKKDFTEWVGGVYKYGKLICRRKDRCKLILDLLPDNLQEELKLTTAVFRGGFTHGSYYYANNVLGSQKGCNVISEVNGVDFTSSYPYCLNAKKFPMSKPIRYDGVEESDLQFLTDNNYYYYAKFKFYGITLTEVTSIESVNKTVEYIENGGQFAKTVSECKMSVDNGRIMSAHHFTVYLTDLDYASYKEFYKWDKVEISELCAGEYGYLPEYVLKTMNIQYTAKYELKEQGLDGTTPYRIAKAMVNSQYGMTCEKSHIDNYTYDAENGVHRQEMTDKEKEELYNTTTFSEQGITESMKNGIFPPKRILSPLWGVWTTAHARRNLLSIVHQVQMHGDDYDVLYCDTDSIYMKNYEYHKSIISAYNDAVLEDNKAMCKRLNLDYKVFKSLGTFDPISKHNYTRFKYLGAKRYIKECEHDGELKVETTIAGLPKKSLITYAKSIDADPFDIFSDKLTIPPEFVNKSASSYNDTPHMDIVVDYLGNEEIMYSDSSVGLVDIGFQMSLASEYAKLIQNTYELKRRDGHVKKHKKHK